MRSHQTHVVPIQLGRGIGYTADSHVIKFNVT